MGVFTISQNGSSVRLGNQQALRKVQEMVCFVGWVFCLNFLTEWKAAVSSDHLTTEACHCKSFKLMGWFLQRRLHNALLPSLEVEVGSSGLRFPHVTQLVGRESLNTRESSESRRGHGLHR